MKLCLKDVVKCMPDARPFNVPAETEFQRVDIAHIPSFDGREPDGQTLYVCTYEHDADADGWYLDGFDRTRKIGELAGRPNLVLLVDHRVPASALTDAPHVRVRDVHEAVNRLRKCVLERVSPSAVGVTGSVGKTTAAALFQQVLSKAAPCARAYTKRLTPLTLSSWIVNDLEPEHRYLSLEYAMHRKHHVARLADLLRPEMATFLNVRGDHVGFGDIASLDDIVVAKSALMERAQHRVYNADDPLLRSRIGSGDFCVSITDPNASAYARLDGEVLCLRFPEMGTELSFRPYLRTHLFLYQTAAAGLIGLLQGVSPKDIGDALGDFQPEENRIAWCEVGDRKVLLDGEMTSGDRLVELGSHQYHQSALLIDRLDFGEAEPSEQLCSRVADAFEGFDVVRLADSAENRRLVEQWGWEADIVSPAEMLRDIADAAFVVLHSGGLFRSGRGGADLLPHLGGKG